MINRGLKAFNLGNIISDNTPIKIRIDLFIILEIIQNNGDNIISNGK